MPDHLAARSARLLAALGFMEIASRGLKPDAAGALERWLHSWAGLGAVLDGMRAQGFDVELKQYPSAWRATFYPTGIAHSIVHGSAYEATPWRAVQRAAWAALNDFRTAAKTRRRGWRASSRFTCYHVPKNTLRSKTRRSGRRAQRGPYDRSSVEAVAGAAGYLSVADAASTISDTPGNRPMSFGVVSPST